MLKLRILILLTMLCSAGMVFSQPLHADGTMVVVGNMHILRSEIEVEKAQLLREYGPLDTTAYACDVARKLIIRKLMLYQAAEVDSISIADERLDAEIDNRLRAYIQQAGSESALEAYIGKSLAEYREEIRPKMKEQLLIQEMENKITSNVKISPAEVKQFFDTIPKDSMPIIQSEVEVAQLILEPPISAEARQFAREQLEYLRERILNGESFEKLASVHSEDPGSKEQGGLLPEFGRGDMVPEFERMAFKLKPDSVSPVFESAFGYHIIKLIQRKGEKIIARHILIRPQNSTADLVLITERADSIFDAVSSGKMTWCNAAHRYMSKNFGDKGNCGFMKDESTGSQKILFDALSPEMKQVVEKLQPGQLSKPQMIRTPDGRQVLRIIYLRAFIPPHEANLTQDYGRIQVEAEAMKKQNVLNQWVEKTRKTTYIRINHEYLNCPDLYLWEESE